MALLLKQLNNVMHREKYKDLNTKFSLLPGYK